MLAIPYILSTMAKVMISLPDELLERIDRAAERRQLTRSGFLRTAARRELGERSGRERARAAETLVDLASRVSGPPAAELVRAERDRLDARDADRSRR
jgi:Arc/MetJ-type ribon-helix-helix transcriptional regulator